MGIQAIERSGKIMDENLINLDDLQEALAGLGNENYDALAANDEEEMEASKRRYEEYIKKNM